MHTLALDADPEALFHSFHRSQVQRNIRRAEREGVLVRSAERESELTDLFYELHCATRRRLGVPVQPRRFFRLLWEEILESGRGFVLIADVDGAPAAAAVFLTSPSTVTYKYGASDSRHWSKRPNHALFWAAIRIACERGCQAFDFGRTDLGDHGLRQFKLGWATDEQPLVYSFLCGARPGSAAKRSVSAQLLQPVIRRSPLFVSRALGALLYKYSA
jgi:lipid II:glycine glycyltransferase (peptidoglycan interpeptide bridge formation enzyme)